MNIIYLELRPANSKCWFKFTDVAKEQYNGKPIFEHAKAYANLSSSFKRNGRRIEIVEIGEDFLRVKLYSAGKLEMASRAMAGFTRELLRVDKEMYPEDENYIFRPFMLNGALFRYEQISDPIVSLAEGVQYVNPACDGSKVYTHVISGLDVEMMYREDISDVDALKLCVDLFCGNASKLRSDYKELEDAKEQIKKVLEKVLYTSYEYGSKARMLEYYQRINQQMKKREDK